MGVFNAAGTRVTKTGLPKTTFTGPDQKFVITADLYETRPYAAGTPGSQTDPRPEGSQKSLLIKAGKVLKQSEIDALFPPATIAALTPATGAVAGGTVIELTGTNLDGVTSVTFGGTAGTALTVTSSTSLTVTAPAKSAGTYDVIVVDDSGNTTKTAAYTAA